MAETPPKVVGASWDGSSLTITLDKPVSNKWVAAIGHMGRFTSAPGAGPEAFSFRGNKAIVSF